MVTNSRTPLRPDRLRPLNAPLPVGVGVNPDGNLAYVVRGESRIPTETVLDSWTIEDEWWRHRISRRYMEVMLEGGKRALLFEDLMTGEWFEQTP